MDIVFTTTILAVAAVTAAILTGALIWAIADNMIRARAPRRDLARRLASLPMGALLSRLGGDPQQYLHRTGLVDVHHRLGACAACEQAERCQRLLKSRCEASAFGFCPNFTSLSAAAAERQARLNPYQGTAAPPVCGP